MFKHSLKLTRYLIITAPILAALVSCGEMKTPREIQRLQNREELNQRYQELKEVVGDYEGTLFEARSGLNKPLRLSIVLTGQPNPGDGIPDETVAPTLSASLEYFYDQTQPNGYTTFNFTQSDYDSQTRLIRFFSSKPEGSLLGTLSKDGTTIKGSWSMSTRGLLGKFKISKTN